MPGITAFVNTMPQSLHFYPLAKKIYKQDNLFEKSELKIRRLVKAFGYPYFIDFYKHLDEQTC